MATLKVLAEKFTENFSKYESHCSSDVRGGGPFYAIPASPASLFALGKTRHYKRPRSQSVWRPRIPNGRGYVGSIQNTKRSMLLGMGDLDIFRSISKIVKRFCI